MTRTPLPDPDDPFADLESHDSTPSVPLTRIERIRFSELAGKLENARLQAYIEVNLGAKALEVVQKLIPLLAGLI